MNANVQTQHPPAMPTSWTAKSPRAKIGWGYRAIGTSMLVYTALSLPDAWYTAGVSDLVHLVVAFGWLYRGWCVYNWTWTLTEAQVVHLDAHAAAQDPTTTSRTLMIREWFRWTAAIIAGRGLLLGGGWLLAVGTYLVVPIVLELSLGFIGLAFGAAYLGSRRLSVLVKSGLR